MLCKQKVCFRILYNCYQICYNTYFLVVIIKFVIIRMIFSFWWAVWSACVYICICHINPNPVAKYWQVICQALKLYLIWQNLCASGGTRGVLWCLTWTINRFYRRGIRMESHNLQIGSILYRRGPHLKEERFILMSFNHFSLSHVLKSTLHRKE